MISQPFAELFAGDRAKLRATVEKMTDTIARSFEEPYGRMAHRTTAEINRRFAICERWYRILRGDRQWSSDRALDELPRALRASLTGEPYEPSKRAVWVPPRHGEIVT